MTQMKRFSMRTEVIVGTDALEALTRFRGKRVAIITDAFMAASGIVERITKRLIDCEIEAYTGVVPDPPLPEIARGARALAPFRPDAIVAVGGGSSIDAAKAILSVLTELNPDRSITLVAVPTTSGTGSEVTTYAVVSDPETRTKYPLTSEALRPALALLDPDLVRSVPPKITADTGMDVITHAIEAYVATGATDFTDALAEKAFCLAFHNLPIAFANGDDLAARAALHAASCMAGMAFDAAGLGLNHGLAHAIGGRFHLPHGRINAMLLPLVVAFNAGMTSAETPLLPSAARYAELARRVGLGGGDDRRATAMLIAAFGLLNKRFGIPATLRDAGVDKADLSAAATSVVGSALADPCTACNPRRPSSEDVSRLLDAVAG